MMQILGLLQLLAVGFVLALAITVWMVMFRLRHPPRRTYASAVARGQPSDPSELDTPREFDSWMVSCRRGRRGAVDFELWDIPGDDPEGPVVIAVPGWGDSRLGVLARLDGLAPDASHVLAWEPPGLGEAKGTCSLGVYEPEFLQQICEAAHNVFDRDVVLYGWSMGAGISIATAGQMDDAEWLRRVIAEAPYRLAQTPAFNVLRLARMPYRLNGPIAFWLMGMRLGVGAKWRGFDRAKRASRMRMPLCVMHGSEDVVCPIEDGRQIAASARHGEFCEIVGGGHNDLWIEDEFRRQMVEFVRAHVRAGRLPRESASGSLRSDAALA